MGLKTNNILFKDNRLFGSGELKSLELWRRLTSLNVMFARVVTAILVVVSFFLVISSLHADNHYMATWGTNSGTCTQEKPCQTLRYAMTQMAGGDTLYIADGTYTGSNNLIDQTHVPPSGTQGRYTTIRAANIPCQDDVPCNQTLKVTFSNGAGIYMDSFASSNYVKIQGVYIKGNLSIMGTSHWYFKQCAVQGMADGNSAKVTNMSSTYTVFEDVVAFGKGRYGFLFYDYSRAGTPQYAVCRRCIHRADWVNDITNPMAGFNVYFAHDVALLNCIDIDGNDPTKWSTAEIMSSFSQVNDASAINYFIQGSISINNAYAVGELTNGASEVYYTDVVGVHTVGGIGTKGSSILNRVTLLDIGLNNFTGFSRNPDTYNIGVDYMYGASTTRSINNTIIRDTQGNATRGAFTGDYLNFYSAGTSSFTPAHVYTTDPYSNGLLYPVRIEAGSTLKTQGMGGGQIGAQIVNKIGADGLEYNVTGWNTEGASLWPWPKEDWVHAQFAAMDTTIGGNVMPSPTRGFAAPGQTLTKYIWQYLGNNIPAEIYGDQRPSPPEGLSILSQ